MSESAKQAGLSTRIEGGKFLDVESKVEGLAAERSPLHVEIGPDGKARAVAFFDIDGTLAHIKFVHGAAIEAMFPEVEPNELQETFFAGFKLGTAVREFDRMIGIYKEGKSGWRDPETYVRERLGAQSDIDNGSSDAHQSAMAMLQTYGERAAEAADRIFRESPDKFEEAKLQPIFRLAELYKRLGIPMMGMTANPLNLVKAVAKYLALDKLFIDIATEEDMVGGGKELAIPKLIATMEDLGIGIPKDRLIIAGDSLRGDIGSGQRLSDKDPEVKTRGVLVIQDSPALNQLQATIAGSEELQKIVSTVDTEALVIDNVAVDENGQPLIRARGSKKATSKFGTS